MSTATNTLTSGIKTRLNTNGDPHGYIVEWIEWDSDFRNSELQHADIIIAVNQKTYLKENQQADHPKAIGNYQESGWWAEQNFQEGQTITLQVVRDGEPVTVTGKLKYQQVYVNTEQRMTLGDNGPVRMSNDGFSSSWANWYEKFVRHIGMYIDDKRWERTTLDNRRLLKEHLEWKERIDFLLQRYPGRFSSTVLADWEKVTQILEGQRYDDITAATLAYRQIGQQRVTLVKEASAKAKAAFLNSIAADSVPAFPATDPVHGDIPAVAGKKVGLPAISFNNFINDLGKTFAIIGSAKDGFYFIHLNSKEMDVFFKTLFHYKAQVTPDIPERYAFIAEILNQPAILTYEGKQVTGLMVKALAGTAGDDHVFIDIKKCEEKNYTGFAGEEALTIFDGHKLDDTATPQQTIEAMIQYIKLGDMASWKKLFCYWQIYSEWGGPPYIDLTYYHTEESYQNTWEKSRRQILNDIYDARVLFTGPVKTVIEPNPTTGVPKVEQVKLIVDHAGLFDGVYSSVSNLYVHRKWTLQRLNGGPWKITYLQGL